MLYKTMFMQVHIFVLSVDILNFLILNWLNRFLKIEKKMQKFNKRLGI